MTLPKILLLVVFCLFNIECCEFPQDSDDSLYGEHSIDEAALGTVDIFSSFPDIAMPEESTKESLRKDKVKFGKATVFEYDPHDKDALEVFKKSESEVLQDARYSLIDKLECSICKRVEKKEKRLLNHMIICHLKHPFFKKHFSDKGGDPAKIIRCDEKDCDYATWIATNLDFHKKMSHSSKRKRNN